MRRALALLLALCLCFPLPALAAETAPEAAASTCVAMPSPAPWAVPYLADARALKLMEEDNLSDPQGPVTSERIAALAEQVYAKLALLTEGETAAPALDVTGNTRGDVMAALGAAVNASGLDAAAPITALQKLGVVQGDGASLALERTCTNEEAVVMTTRLVLNAYDSKNAGSKGLLWKATHGDNTVYLLGTAHMERNNLYPFHQTLRSAIQSADTVVLELDFQDQTGMEAFVAMQSYSDGDCLKNHIPAQLYTRTVNALIPLGLSEDMTNTFKPWALANTFTSLMTSDDTAGDAPMAIDLYVNAAAVDRGATVTGAESYALQGGIFDTLSDDYQALYLDSGVTLWEAALAAQLDPAAQEADPEVQAALEAQQAALNAIMDAWQSGDAAAFEAVYGKEAIVNSEDELNSRLFTDRDPNLVEVARSYLEGEGSHTTLLAFGAGHMVAPGGIVPELEKLGYDVSPVTNYQAVPPVSALVTNPDGFETVPDASGTASDAAGNVPDASWTDPDDFGTILNAQKTTITLSFAGDTMLAADSAAVTPRNFNGFAAAQDPSYFLAGVRDIFQNDDFTVLDLENVLSDRALKPTDKGEGDNYWYKSAAKNAEILRSGGVEVVSLSNNHTEDYGEAGLSDTKAAVEAVGVQWGNRDKTVYLEKNGYKIAIICGGLWNSGYHLDILKNRLAEASQASDFQVVFFHGGEMRVHKPDSYKVAACHALVDAGADLVVGSHPHVLQPLETYNGVEIVYSLGNFCYGGSAYPENATVVYQLTLEVENGVLTAKTSQLIPCMVYTGFRNNFQPMALAPSPERQAILDFMNGLRNSPI